jgi:DNA (cytosine-5)-methyltransferase 1
MKIKYIDLFCGIGSFHYSFNKIKNMECVFACDINENARKTYFENYNFNPEGDINSIDIKKIPKFNLLTAGFPCQSFSVAGNHKGLNDARGQLFNHIINIIEYHKPEAIILENVPALLTNDKGNTFLYIKNKLETQGYNLSYKVLNCNDYGIPKMRKRLFIICSLNKIPDDFFMFDEFKKNIKLCDYLNIDIEKPISYTIRCGGRRSPINDKHNWDGYLLKNGNEYRLTLNDCLKLQGFYDFKLIGSDSEKWKMVGNTIPTIFTYIIGINVEKLLTK